jgi:hypothetical protein
MKCSAFNRFLRDLLSTTSGRQQNGPTERRLNIRPLSVGLRIDTKLRASTEHEPEVSQLIWVSPARSPESVKVLKVLLHPN